MAKIQPPKREVTSEPKSPLEQAAPSGNYTTLQIRGVSDELRDDFKVAVLKSPYKNMAQLFEAMLQEYKEKHML
tara:strand:- start:88 stop:309 length:222 start_codon:yes stop_codon:yes gene_type:complete